MPDPETAGVASSEAGTTVSQAGAGAGGAQAGVGAEQRGVQTGAAQSGAGAAGQAAQQETGMDIGQAEDGIKELAVASKAWNAQMKRIVAGELNLDAHLQAITGNLFNRVVNASADFDNTLKQITLQVVQNAVAEQGRGQTNSRGQDHRREVNAGTSDARVQVVGESTISENPVLQDIIAAAVTKAYAVGKAEASVK